MLNEIVFDIETQNTFDEVGGYFTDKLKLSVIGVYFFATDEYKAFEQADLPTLFPLFEKSTRLIGFNSIYFDLPVLNNYYMGDLRGLPQLDILKEVEKSIGFRLKLDSIAQATLGMGKSGHGLQAVQWWREGKVQAVKDYCLQDVKVTKEIYEFGLKNGYLLYDDRAGERQVIEVDFRAVATPPSAVNLTLGL